MKKSLLIEMVCDGDMMCQLNFYGSNVVGLLTLEEVQRMYELLFND